MNAASLLKLAPAATHSQESTRTQSRETKEQGSENFDDVFAHTIARKRMPQTTRKNICRSHHVDAPPKFEVTEKHQGIKKSPNGSKRNDRDTTAESESDDVSDPSPNLQADAADPARIGLICFSVPVIVVPKPPDETITSPKTQSTETGIEPVETSISKQVPPAIQPDGMALTPVPAMAQTQSAENSVAEEKITPAVDGKIVPTELEEAENLSVDKGKATSKQSKSPMIVGISAFDGERVTGVSGAGNFASKTDGTGGAKSPSQMKTIGKQYEKTAATTQNVEIVPALDLNEGADARATRASHQSLSAGQDARAELTANAVTSLPVTIEISKPGLQEVAATPATRLLDSISKEVAVVRNMKAERLTVVLRPDSETQLMLHLNVRNGKIEAMAQFEHGDFQLLNAHWSELQHSLEQQGVRLQPLQDPDAHFHTGYSSNDNFQQAKRETQAEAGENFIGSKKAASAPGAPSKAAAEKSKIGRRLLESWA